jgi:lambda repressor-like predicted transcriptional regulator
VVSSDYARNRAFVDDALGFAGDPATVYREGDATCKRLLAFAFFCKILVHELPPTVPPPERRVLEVSLMEPYDQFYSPEVAEAADKWADQHLPAEGQASHGPGSTVASLNLGPLGPFRHWDSNVNPWVGKVRMYLSDGVSGISVEVVDEAETDARGPMAGPTETATTSVTPEVAALIVTDLEAGESVRGIARKYHLHRSTVTRNLRKAGVPPIQTTGVTKQPNLIKEANRLRREGLSLRQIAKEMGVSHPTVHRLLNV